MSQTEEEARSMICPTLSSATVPRSCKGSDCMAWVFPDESDRGYCHINQPTPWQALGDDSDFTNGIERSIDREASKNEALRQKLDAATNPQKP